MSYIGNNLQVAYPSYTNIDDISGSFNGVTTSFALTVGGVAPVPAPLSSNQCMISVGGVIQRPDDTGTEGFRLSGGNIVFSSAPNTGEDFFGVILAGADYVNVGVNFPSGSASTPSITFDTDLDTGLYNPAANELGITTAGTNRLVVDSSGNVNIDSNTLYVDAVNNRVGVGTTTPSAELEVIGEAKIGSTSYPIRFATGASTGVIEFPNTSARSVVRTLGATPLEFEINSSPVGRFDSSGRLLVGTSTAPSSVGPLQIVDTISPVLVLARNDTSINTDNNVGEIRFLSNDSTAYEHCATIAASADGAFADGDKPTKLVFSTTANGASSPTERMRISNGGTIKAPGVYNLTTASAANVFVASDGDLARSISSSKYKTDIETLDDSYSDALLSCRPVWYRSTCDTDNPAHSFWGFIAEEVAAIDPRLVHWKTVEVTYDDNGSAVETPCDPEPEGVAYDRFVPHLLNLIKRQKEQIEAMEARLTALEQS